MATDTQSSPQMIKRNDAYTGLLAISFLAMVGGCVLLYLEFEQYENLKPPGKTAIDVPGTLRPAPTPPKEAPKVIPPPDNQDNPMPMPMMDKDKAGRLPVEGPGDALVIPTIPVPDPSQIPGKAFNPIIPASATEAGKFLPLQPVEIPSAPMIPNRQVPATEAHPGDLPPQPIIPDLGLEPASGKTPLKTLPPRNEPGLDDLPPPVKPFVPPMM